MRSKGVVYILMMIGPSTEPCGTPQSRACGSDVTLPNFTQNWRSDKYDLNQCSAVPLITNLSCSSLMKMVWSTVSKAADKSIMASISPQFLTSASEMSLWMRISADSVE